MYCKHITNNKRSIDLAGVPDAHPALLDKLEGIRLGHYSQKPYRFDQFVQVCKDFKVGPMIPYYTTYVHDQYGREVCSYSKFSQSFVLNSCTLLQVQFSQATVNSLTNITGGSVNVPLATINLSCAGSAGTTTSGIVWGTGTTAVTTSDTKLVTQIAHGTGAGQLSYGAGSIGSATAAPTQVTLTNTRSATNGSGGTVTIQEVGIYWVGNTSQFCAVRDLNTQAVTSTQTLTTVYTQAFLL